jgi:hypothetical protein
VRKGQRNVIRNGMLRKIFEPTKEEDESGRYYIIEKLSDL